MSVSIPTLRLGVALVALLVAGPLSAQDQAQDQAPAQPAPPAQPDPTTVVADVNGREVTLGDVVSAKAALGQQMQQVPLQAIYPMLLDRVISTNLLAAAAEESGIAEDEQVAAELQRARTTVLSGAYVQQEMEQRITEESLRARYEAMQDDPAMTFEEVKARHILVESEEEADAIIEQLDGGGDFASLAESESIGPSGAQGGDLGYFREDAMVAPFAEAAFAMEVGSYTQDPVETQFGFHVILVEDRRTNTVSFEQAAAQIEQEAVQEEVRVLIEDLREGAEIARFNMDGSPMQDAGGAPAAGQSADDAAGGSDPADDGGTGD